MYVLCCVAVVMILLLFCFVLLLFLGLLFVLLCFALLCFALATRVPWLGVVLQAACKTPGVRFGTRRVVIFARGAIQVESESWSQAKSCSVDRFFGGIGTTEEINF